jgi:hypothetical protein
MFQMFQCFNFFENKLRKGSVCEWFGELFYHNVLLTDSIPGVTFDQAGVSFIQTLSCFPSNGEGR